MVVLADRDPGLQVFLVRRHARSGFLGGAVVFPGGKVDEADAAEGWSDLVSEADPRASVFESERVAARALLVAACRETLEEGAILPIERGVGIDPLVLRSELEKSHDFMALIRASGLRLAMSSLAPWARWVTPEAESRRYDARFFLLELPAGQTGRHDDHETTMSFWATPAEVLAQAARGEVFMAPPTTRTLELLATVRDVASAKKLAKEQSLAPICPHFVPADEAGAPFLALPGDPAHPVAASRVTGPSRFVLRDGRFVSEAPRGPMLAGRDPGRSRGGGDPQPTETVKGSNPIEEHD